MGKAMPNQIDEWIDKIRKRKELSLEEATSPEAFWYTDDAFFQFERDSVFKKSWQYVGRSDQLIKKGDYFSGDLFGLPYLVVYDEGPRAFYNICSHHATCLVEGEGRVSELKCPYHGWVYNFQGELKKIPQAGPLGKLNPKNLKLTELPLKKVGPFIFLNFGQEKKWEGNSLESVLTDYSYEGFKFVESFKYRLKCNWKVFVDNYLDGGYHVPHMHPGLTEQIDFSSYKTVRSDFFSVQTCSSRRGNQSSKEGDFLERVEGKSSYFWLYPNFMVNLYGRWMDTNWVRPIKSNECEVIFDYFYRGILNDELKRKSLKASGKVQEEDTLICERVQKGLESGLFSGGPYVPKFEGSMYDFHQQLIKSYLEF